MNDEFRTSPERMSQIAKRVAKRIKTNEDWEKEKYYLIGIGWTKTETEQILKKAKIYKGKE